MKLEKVIPFGHLLDEYKKMFALSDKDLDKRIVGVADGPASFNADIFALRICLLLYLSTHYMPLVPRKLKSSSIVW